VRRTRLLISTRKTVAVAAAVAGAAAAEGLARAPVDGDVASRLGEGMYVPGYGQAEAADVGGGVHGRWIDLGYDDGNFINWHQYVTVYFLTPVPPASSIVWIFP
jgi:hypothetical protein